MPPAVLDIVGTGGDGIGSVNISTGACVLAAAAGAHVAKHGSRAVSSSCGAADVLEVMTHMQCWMHAFCSTDFLSFFFFLYTFSFFFLFFFGNTLMTICRD